jgi:hypothetical protein
MSQCGLDKTTLGTYDLDVSKIDLGQEICDCCQLHRVDQEYAGEVSKLYVLPGVKIIIISFIISSRLYWAHCESVLKKLKFVPATSVSEIMCIDSQSYPSFSSHRVWWNWLFVPLVCMTIGILSWQKWVVLTHEYVCKITFLGSAIVRNHDSARSYIVYHEMTQIVCKITGPENNYAIERDRHSARGWFVHHGMLVEHVECSDT